MSLVGRCLVSLHRINGIGKIKVKYRFVQYLLALHLLLSGLHPGHCLLFPTIQAAVPADGLPWFDEETDTWGPSSSLLGSSLQGPESSSPNLDAGLAPEIMVVMASTAQVASSDASTVPANLPPKSNTSPLTGAGQAEVQDDTGAGASGILIFPDGTNTRSSDSGSAIPGETNGAEAGSEPTSGPDAPSLDGEPAGQWSVESLQSRRDEIERRSDLDETLKTTLLKHFERSIDLLNQRLETERRHAKLKNEKDNAPTLIADLKAELAQAAPSSEPEVLQDASVAELDRLRLVDQEKLEEARRNLEGWESRAKNRAERRPQLPAIIETTRRQLEETRKLLETQNASENENPLQTSARRLELQSQLQLLAAQLELYRVEQLRFEALQEMFPLQRDSLTRIRNALERKAERWKEILANARLSESERQRSEARKQLESAHPALRDLAERNSQLTQLRQEHLQLRGQWKQQQASVNESLETVKQKFEDVKERVGRVGLTTAIGLTLRNQKGQLPDARSYARRGREAEREFIRLQSEQLLLDDERKSLDDIEARIDRAVNAINSSEVSEDDLRKMTRELLTLQREYLEAILSDFDSSLTMLVDIDFSCRQLADIITEYDSYIDERVLWIRSAAPLNWDTPRKTLHSIAGFFSHPQWIPLLQFLTADVKKQWVLYLIWAAATLCLVRLCHHFPGGISRKRPPAINQLDSGIRHAFWAVCILVVTAAQWPIALSFLGWRLSQSDLNLGEALGDGMQFSAVLLWLLNSFRHICSRSGVAQTFWQWPESAVQSLRSGLWVYIVLGVPLGWVVVVSQKLDDGAGVETVGRLALISFCALLSLILGKTLRPSGPLVNGWLRSSMMSSLYKLRLFWYPIFLIAPLIIAGLAASGYQYTAEQLTIRLEWTIGLVVGLAIACGLLKQWLIAARRRLAIKQAQARREAERNAAAGNSPNNPIPVAEPPQLDLSLLNRQVIRMVQVTSVGLFLTGCWLIWDQVFPAIQVFGRVELWSSVVSVSEIVETASGTEVREISRIQPVTRGHLMMALALFVTAMLASRNLPGLMELSILQKLPMDSGSRNAIKILSGYAILAAGIIATSNMIGLRWNSVQWLVAALTVGLGFGLQEIFANFVSGLIILFERPVRIGDIVTIDGVSGTVSRIQIRATTITDWDRKEFIVPNKEFVTGRLLNWTLSDKTTRVLVNVGIASGADVATALELMRRSAEEHPIILDDPAPIATFEGFGDGTLNLVLRSYLPNLDHRLQVITDLHTAINQRFREYGIAISFPQRGLHIHGMLPAAQSPISIDCDAAEGASSIPMEIGRENLHIRSDSHRNRHAA